MSTDRDNETERLYSDLASWWPVMSAPEDYEEEAVFFARVLRDSCRRPCRTVLELGSGGGNNASHLKAHFEMTLVDRAPGMLEVSRALNPTCAHMLGDMRTIRLDRSFDAVFIHDAISYLTTERDLKRALETAFIHCAPGGAAIFVPDNLRETFRGSTDHDGHDDGQRAMRYLEWTWDPDPSDSSHVVDYAFLLRESNGEMRIVHDRHHKGLFAQADWLRLIAEVGFEPSFVPFDHSTFAPEEEHVVFIGVRPA